MTTAEIRIEGTQKRIDKLNAKIGRHNAKIAKLQAIIDAGKATTYPNGLVSEQYDIDHEKDEIRRATKDLAIEQVKLAEYNAKRKAEIEKELKKSDVPAINEFMKAWEIKAFEFYIKLRADFEEFKKNNNPEVNKENLKRIRRYGDSGPREYSDEKIDEILAGWETLPQWKRDSIISELKSRARIEWVSARGKSNVSLAIEDDETLKKIIHRDAENRKDDLIARVEEKAGKIADAKNLYLGVDGSINGFVVGNIKTVEVQTIYAGGYNIQCLHYRVLVK